MNMIKKILLLVLSTTLLVGSIGYGYLHNLVTPYAQGVHQSIKATYIAMFSSEFTGAYWENKMLDEYNSHVKYKPVAERLDYFLAVLIKEDLDTSKATFFVGMVGDDSSEFGVLLRNIKAHPVYSSLNAKSIERIEVWKNNFK
ncbi:hypothetical protein [Rheinheimera baltica]|uniref:hypothetical protein n=1 Tax=Rheinheimera baltica TaxID=67576 RepID=UPI00273F5867|nr:hypothetical protein [Rheinheimera baltica]MDP5190044.1 hypothetical protein [Rheinheimera baltica]